MTKNSSPDSLNDTLTEDWQRLLQNAAPSVLSHYLGVAAQQGQVNRLSFMRATYAQHLSRADLTFALISAAARGQEKACRLLLGWGADARRDRRALIAAIRGNHGFVTDLLLRAGATLDNVVIEHREMSPLALALEGGHKDSAKALLLHGANPNIMHTPTGSTLRALATTKGLLDTRELMDRLWPTAPRIPADFVARLPLEVLRGPFPDHGGFTGYQLAAYHGQMSALLQRLTADGRRLTKSDLIMATPRYPQTVLFILGQQGRLAEVFDPRWWPGNAAGARDLLRYVPAAFRPQLDAAHIPTRLQQEIWRQQRRPHLRL